VLNFEIGTLKLVLEGKTTSPNRILKVSQGQA
jgi:hypothetical protein